MNKLMTISAIAILATTASQAQAYDQGAWAAGLGYAEVFGDKNNAVVGNLEYRSSAFSPKDTYGISNISWIAGVETDTNTSAYAYGGFLYDLPLTDEISLSPSFSAGLYHAGEGKNLGGALEFRSNLELNYKVTPESRVGVALSHKSNAGIYSHNPGTETLQVTYSTSMY